jgi:hypothetical protein
MPAASTREHKTWVASQINAGGSVNVSEVAERHECLQTHQGSRSGVVSDSGVMGSGRLGVTMALTC